MDEIIAKVGLATKITSVALDCPYCRGIVKQLIRDYKNSVRVQPDIMINTDLITENLQEGGPSTDCHRLTEHKIQNDILQKSN